MKMRQAMDWLITSTEAESSCSSFEILQSFDKLMDKILCVQPSPCFCSRLFLDLIPDARSETHVEKYLSI